MQGQYIQYGSSAPTARLFFYNTADGTPATVLFNAASLALVYARDNSANVALTLVTATLGTWVANGFISRGGGVHDLYLPLAAALTGARFLTVLPSTLPAGVSMNSVIIPLVADDLSAAGSTDTGAASAVRTNLTTELARIDAPVSGALTNAVLGPQLASLRQQLSVGARFGGPVSGGSQAVLPVYDAGNSVVLLGTVIIYRDADGNIVGQSALTPP